MKFLYENTLSKVLWFFSHLCKVENLIYHISDMNKRPNRDRVDLSLPFLLVFEILYQKNLVNHGSQLWSVVLRSTWSKVVSFL